MKNHSFGANSRASQVGASPWFISVAFWSGIGCCTLVMSQWPITPFATTRSSASFRNFAHVAPSFALEVCLALSHHQKVLIRLHAHYPCSDTSHSESFSKIIIYDRETASSSGLSHVPSNPMSIPIPRGMICRDSCLQPSTRNSLGTSGHVFEGLHARGEASSALSEKSKNLASSACRLKPTDTGRVAKKREGLRKEPQDCAIPTTRFVRKFSTWNPFCSTGGPYSQKLYDGKSEKSYLGTAF